MNRLLAWSIVSVLSLVSCVELGMGAWLMGSGSTPSSAEIPDAGTSADASSQPDHVHCGVNTVFCWNSDGHCCKVCHGPCP